MRVSLYSSCSAKSLTLVLLPRSTHPPSLSSLCTTLDILGYSLLYAVGSKLLCVAFKPFPGSFCQEAARIISGKLASQAEQMLIPRGGESEAARTGGQGASRDGARSIVCPSRCAPEGWLLLPGFRDPPCKAPPLYTPLRVSRNLRLSVRQHVRPFFLFFCGGVRSQRVLRVLCFSATKV